VHLIGIWLGLGFWRIIRGILRWGLVGGRFEEERQGKGRYRRFLIADYEAGDVVFHYPCSMHASCSNQGEEARIRLSADLRFNSKKDWNVGRADERSMNSWGLGDGAVERSGHHDETPVSCRRRFDCTWWLYLGRTICVFNLLARTLVPPCQCDYSINCLTFLSGSSPL
jgi:hypothetical protein